MYCSTVIVILHETKLAVASAEEEQQEVRVLNDRLQVQVKQI